MDLQAVATSARARRQLHAGLPAFGLGCQFLVAAFVSLLAVAEARAQAPAFLVKDINRQAIPLSSDPSGMITVPGRAFFVVRGGPPALWTTDGTPAGTRMVHPLRYPSSVLPAVGSANGRVYFTTYSGRDPELWLTDGTEAGTTRVSAIATVDPNAYPVELSLFTDVNGTLYFIAAANSSEPELWRSDGTESGTMRVKGLDCCVERLVDVDGTLFFTADNSSPWRSDGSEAGTVPIVDEEGNALQQADELVAIGSTLFFTASSRRNAPQLWAIDADDTVARPLAAPRSSARSPFGLTDVRGSLYFLVPSGNGGASLWRSDGSESGTVLLLDLGNDLEGLRFPRELDGKLLFTAARPGGLEGLWISDGTSAGTRQLSDGEPDFRASFDTFLRGDGVVYFSASDGKTGQELWITDGSVAGTRRVRDILPGERGAVPRPLAVLDGTLLFSADDGLTGRELWKSDGTEAGTTLLANIRPDQEEISEPIPYAAVGGELFFSANDGIHGRELWRSDGTDEGTVLVADVKPGPDWSYLYSAVASGEQLFFVADEGESGYELWKSDGTADGTARVADIAAGTSGAGIGEIRVVGDMLLFAASDGVSGSELWRSDGTAAGTALVADINPGAPGSQPQALTVVNDTLFFFAEDGVHGVGLWKSDGTAPGTTPVLVNAPASIADVRGRIENEHALSTMPAAGVIFFFASDAMHGPELWRSDGTPEHTAMVADINRGPDGSVGGDGTLVTIGNRAIFIADDGIHGEEIWTSDGTAAGTFLVKDIFPGSSSSRPALLTKVGEEVFFVACTPATGSELWKTDGSEAGTFLVRELIPGPYSAWDGYYGNCSFPAGLLSASPAALAEGTTGGDGAHFRPPQLSSVQGHLLFHDVPAGVLFESDGTAGGTRVLTALGVWGAVVAAGPLAYFNAGSSFFPGGDLELWALPLASIGACGNGVLDAGESCDTGGESDTCNADCTPPACGDGLTNRSAGEECDNGGNSGDSDCCRADCTARPVDTPCTDWNACTDGDACDGQGHCTAGVVPTCDDEQAFTRDLCTADQGCLHSDGCWGDCNGDRSVVVNELVTVVQLALGAADPSQCIAGVSATQQVDIVTLIRSVYNALNGCHSF